MSKKPDQIIDNAVDKDEAETPAVESKLHYYLGVLLLGIALFALAWQLCTSNSLFFENVQAFREGQMNSESH